MEEDLIIGEPQEKDGLDIIDNQLTTINSVVELDDSLYDEMKEDKIKVIVRAMKIIYKVQSNILKEI